jgi:hypothetical protein
LEVEFGQADRREREELDDFSRAELFVRMLKARL